MSKPDDIPADVLAVAEKIATDHCAVIGDERELSEDIACAIMAERERCADLLKDPVAVRLNWLRGGINADSIIATERERCAALADAFELDSPDDEAEFVNKHLGYGWDAGFDAGCTLIARAIRKSGEDK